MFMANIAINHSITEHRQLHILALDIKDVFGSVAPMLLDHNLECMNLPLQLGKIAIDSYKCASVNMMSRGAVQVRLI
jgi:hypothetical protein